MHPTTRLKKSRDLWKTRLREKSKRLKIASRTIKRQAAKIESLLKKDSEVTKTLSVVDNLAIVSPRQIVVRIEVARVIRILCVMLVIVAVVSFRSVPRILMILSRIAIKIPWIPHFTSVVNWTFRYGLAKLKSVVPIEEPWIAIIDCTVDIGFKKALIALRVKISALEKKGSALSLEDCQCIGIEVGTTWNGETVCAALECIFSASGAPVAILKDCGSDLSRGVRLWRETFKSKSVVVIDDIGHAIANALKATYANKKCFKNFLNTIKSGATKLQQSDIAFLAPPRVRTKGRFQSIQKIGAWGERILELIGGQGQQKVGSLAYRLRKMLPHFGIHRKFLEEFAKTASVANSVNKLLKDNGLNRATFIEAIALLETLSWRSLVRRKITKWLHKHLQRQCRMGVGQMPLPVSSDILESLIGKFKVILQRNPKAEFTRNILAIPCLCGPVGQIDITDGLAKVTHADILEWEHENVRESMLKKRRHLLDSEK